MNEQDIDTLSGKELTIAIAEALGWQRKSGSSQMWIVDGEQTPSVFFPDWPADIAAAWELDIDGARWEFEEHYKIVDFPVVWARCFMPTDGYTGEARFSDFPTKAVAYAVARCRAWLKARQAERGQ